MTEAKKLFSRSMAIGLFIIALLIGAVVGVAATPVVFPPPPTPGPVTTTTTVTTPGPVTTTTLTVTPPPTGLRGEVLIGALLPLTGDLASYGENSKVTIEIAAAEVNAFLKSQGKPWTIKLVEENTDTKPGPALDKLTSMAAKGIKLVVGPQTSAEIRNIKSYADANKILLISQSSTAPALRIKGDYVYRFCPDDTIQGPAIARAMWDAGIRYVIPVWRGDAWGDGLQDTTSDAFKKLGGTVVEGIRYAPEAKEFSAEAKALNDKVKSLVAQYGADKVGIDYIAFAEAVGFFTSARAYDDLKKIKWFGSDGTALLAEITAEPLAAEFSVQTKFLNPIFAATKTAKFEQLNSAAKAKLGREPDSYAIAAYDAVWVLALSLLAADKYDADAVISAMPTVLNNYFGATGWIVLNEGGDKAQSDYDLWEIKLVAGKYEWKLVGAYVAATDSIAWTG